MVGGWNTVFGYAVFVALYALLRHNGVDLGKRHFIGVQSWEEIADW